jgi:hypothetical protein
MKSYGKRDPENRSDKACCCGSHSANDRKKNVKHHSTAVRLAIRKSRRLDPKTCQRVVGLWEKDQNFYLIKE